MKIKIVITSILFCTLSSLPAQKGEVARQVDPFLSSIAVSDSGVQRLLVWLDEWEAQSNPEAPRPSETSNLNLSKSNVNRQAGAPIVTSRSNIKVLAQKLDDLENSSITDRSTKLDEVRKALAELEAPITELHNSIVKMGRRYAGKAAELKSRHETVKNAISNIR